MKKREKLVRTAGPTISDKEISYVNDAVVNGWNENWNNYIVKFERAFEDYAGVKHAMTTSSCTGAMHLAMLGLDIGKGDEVIVPEISWVATASVVKYVGATPVFADIEYDTWCIDPDSIRKSITKKTKAIIPVHCYGHPCNMDEIRKIAEEFNLFVMEDAAPSIGSTYKGVKTGNFGVSAAFSFQGAKPFTTGEGGMFVTNDTEMYKRVTKLGDHGRSLTRTLWNEEIGHKYKMSNIQAALGLAQLERAEEIISKKRKIYSWYKKMLGDVEGITLNAERPDCKTNFAVTNMILERDFGITRDEFIIKLKEWNIDSRPFFYPLSHMPMFERKHNKNAERLSERGINLPAGHNLTEEDIDYVCNVIKLIIGHQ